jgi:hypothetical protein
MPSLFLTTNLHKTIWYEIDENNKITKIDEYAEKKEKFTDHEASFPSGGVSNMGEPDIINSERKHEAKEYIDYITKHTNKLLDNTSYNYFVYSAPETIKNDLLDKLSPTIKDIKTKYMAGNYVNMPEGELLKIFKKSKQSY